MSNEKLDEIKENLEKEINGFIMGGLCGGFQFDEEQAQYLQELLETMNYIFKEQENMIDQLQQALDFSRHTAKTRKEEIERLKVKKEEHYLIGFERGRNDCSLKSEQRVAIIKNLKQANNGTYEDAVLDTLQELGVSIKEIESIHREW